MAAVPFDHLVGSRCDVHWPARFTVHPNICVLSHFKKILSSVFSVLVGRILPSARLLPSLAFRSRLSPRCRPLAPFLLKLLPSFSCPERLFSIVRFTVALLLAYF
uniref:Uncharacterized protein n=1 Tax=Steinernema glaseri TaxID=37863 RepID=A0A1I8AW38_9BILA